jgi:hypothetical protein
MRKATWSDYIDWTSRRLVVHSVPYLWYGLIEYQDPTFGKARRRLGSQYNNFNSFNGSSSDLLCCTYSCPSNIHWDRLDPQYTVYCIFIVIHQLVLTTLGLTTRMLNDVSDEHQSLMQILKLFQGHAHQALIPLLRGISWCSFACPSDVQMHTFLGEECLGSSMSRRCGVERCRRL